MASLSEEKISDVEVSGLLPPPPPDPPDPDHTDSKFPSFFQTMSTIRYLFLNLTISRRFFRPENLDLANHPPL